MRVLAEIPPRSSPELRPGSLRRRELEEFGRLLEGLGAVRSVLALGAAGNRRAGALGLATTAAAVGTRAALLECDLEQPALAESLGLATAPGLHEYLTGAAESEAILSSAVLAGPGAGAATAPLVCVVAGRPVPEGDGERLLASDRFRHAVERLYESHELLVMCGPPSVAPLAGAAIACVTPADLDREPPVPVAGAVVQG